MTTGLAEFQLLLQDGRIDVGSRRSCFGSDGAGCASFVATYNLPSLTLELLDTQDRSLGRRSYFGQGVIGQFNRSQLGQTGHVELRTATGMHQFDLSKIGAHIHYAKLAIYLQNYACEGENSVVLDQLVLLSR